MKHNRSEIPSVFFLDIDGVFRTGKQMREEKEATGKPSPLDNLDRRTIELFNKLHEFVSDLQGIESVVVCSSTWRRHWTLDELNEHFAKFGATWKFSSKTEVTYGTYTRGSEIAKWMSDFTLQHGIQGQNFRRYAILDDEVSEMLQFQDPNVFRINHYLGLHSDEVYHIKRYFQQFYL